MKKKKAKALDPRKEHQRVISSITKLIQGARYASARSVNAIMTATYWEIGRRIVEIEQKGEKKATYGEELIKKMSLYLTKSCGRGFSESSLKNFRQFYLAYPHNIIRQTMFAESTNLLKSEDFSDNLKAVAEQFPLPWSAYVRLTSVENEDARKFYEQEALRGGWSIRQLV